ncbi:MAG: methyltransferase domain-containing protein, partial [Halofilum sp. (in: g-proteobacteria)]
MSDEREKEYSPEFLAMLQQTWGEGFLSPGGREEIAAIVRDLDLSGRSVLDIGSGLGGPAFTLVQDHDVGHVTGIDVESDLVETSRATRERLGLTDRIDFQCVEPGPLPFPDNHFDVVFSKDSVIHIPDKAAFYRDVHRVLKPGGRVAVSDWFCGTDPFTPEMDAWLKATGLSFEFAPIGDFVAIVEDAGFADVETEDRNGWYAGWAR